MNALWVRLERLEYLVQLFSATLTGASPADATLGAPWTFVNNALSPFAAQGAVKFRVDTSAGPVRINLSALTRKQIIIVSPYAGNNPIVIVPASGTIADPSQGNTQQATATLTTSGASWWQFDQTVSALVSLV